MPNERKQDLSGPDEEALEQHIHNMLDVTAPDPEASEKIEVKTPVTPVTKSTTVSKPTKIAVTDSTVPSAPPVKSKKATSKSVSITIEHHDEPAEEPVPPPTATKAVEPSPVEVVAAPSAPLLPKDQAKVTKPKKVAITHFEEPEVASPESEPEPEEPTETAPELEATAAPEIPEEEVAEAKDPDPADASEEDGAEGPESPLEPAIESQETDKAVAEIIASESDELLSIKDQETSTKKPAKVKTKRRGLLALMFKTSLGRWTTFLLLVAVASTVAAVPSYRYAFLNLSGVRSSASVVVLDESTDQPLKNVTVKLAGQTVQTGADGKAQLTRLRLGPTQLTVEKRAFSGVTRSETVGWGSNPLSDAQLKPTGIQYTFMVTDEFSGQPVTTAEATLGDANANADSKGEITLTLDQNADLKTKLVITATGYRDETSALPTSTKQTISVGLTPAHKVAFISKRSGTYDLYTVDADGKNEKLILKGTGNEQDNITLAAHPSEDVAMMISSRDANHDKDGNLLSTLTFVNLKDGTTKSVIQSPQLKAVDWIGTRFVYMQMVTGAGPEDPQRSKLMSYDYTSGDNRQLAAANYFNDVVSAAGKIYYAPAGAFQNGVNNGMFAVYADASGKTALFNQEVWNIFRTGYDQLTMAVQQDWYQYQLGDKPAKLSGQPSNTTTRIYQDSPDGKHSVWLDTRDGKGTLVLYDLATKTEKVLFAQAGIKGPVRWIGNSTLAFRTVTSKETADYGVSIDGGVPKKITDVTDTKGIDRWTY